MKKVMPVPPSWSKICRERIANYIYAIEKGEYFACIQWAIDNLSISYRPEIFKIRCAKMLHRAIKSGKIKEISATATLYKQARKQNKEDNEGFIDLRNIRFFN